VRSSPRCAKRLRLGSRVSRSSSSGCEPETMPAPANRWVVLSLMRPHRKPRATTPSPAPLIQPTPPVYQPRSIDSSCAMRSTARLVGTPPTAGVGWTASITSSSPTPGSSRPEISVERCCTVVIFLSEGTSETDNSLVSDARCSIMLSTTSACSRLSLGDSSSRSPISRSSDFPSPLGALPASGFDLRCTPSTLASSSGLAPMNTASPDFHAKL
jgi:hypothetical protein